MWDETFSWRRQMLRALQVQNRYMHINKFGECFLVVSACGTCLWPCARPGLCHVFGRFLRCLVPGSGGAQVRLCNLRQGRCRPCCNYIFETLSLGYSVGQVTRCKSAMRCAFATHDSLTFAMRRISLRLALSLHKSNCDVGHDASIPSSAMPQCGELSWDMVLVREAILRRGP